MNEYLIKFEKTVAGTIRDEQIVRAHDAQEAVRTFEEENFDVEVLSVNQVKYDDPNQLSFPFLNQSSAMATLVEKFDREA